MTVQPFASAAAFKGAHTFAANPAPDRGRNRTECILSGKFGPEDLPRHKQEMSNLSLGLIGTMYKLNQDSTGRCAAVTCALIVAIMWTKGRPPVEQQPVNTVLTSRLKGTLKANVTATDTGDRSPQTVLSSGTGD
jgi:hypothetical protein